MAQIASRYVNYVDNETYDFSNQAIRFIYNSPPPTSLTLSPSASPATLLTTGTTTLSATVSGGTSPYSYTFSGPGIITLGCGHWTIAKKSDDSTNVMPGSKGIR